MDKGLIEATYVIVRLRVWRDGCLVVDEVLFEEDSEEGKRDLWWGVVGPSRLKRHTLKTRGEGQQPPTRLDKNSDIPQDI